MTTHNKTFFKNKTFGHILFWVIIGIYNISYYWPLEVNKIFLFEKMFLKTSIQIILSCAVIYILVPFLLNKKHKILFAVSSLISVYICYVTYTAVRCYHLVPKYPEVFSLRPPLLFFERIINVYTFLGTITDLIFPTILLMVFDYYRHQKEILLLKEQKKSTELNLLKTQLNPHFLFNTLNNLYALALKKSDRTPEAIAKLSEILDYMLYQCKDNFVPIKSEVALIHNYIALEKIRYGKRLDVTFTPTLKSEEKIAPLLLLTFVENAFKHGVSQEINVAKIHINLKADQEGVFFSIENSKPAIQNNSIKRDAIGLKNIRKQLEILYPSKNYILTIHEDENLFSVILKLTPNDL